MGDMRNPRTNGSKNTGSAGNVRRTGNNGSYVRNGRPVNAQNSRNSVRRKKKNNRSYTVLAGGVGVSIVVLIVLLGVFIIKDGNVGGNGSAAGWLCRSLFFGSAGLLTSRSREARQ